MVACSRHATLARAPFFNSTNGRFGMRLDAEAGKNLTCPYGSGSAYITAALKIDTSTFTLARNSLDVLRSDWRVKWDVRFTTVNVSYSSSWGASADASVGWSLSVVLYDITSQQSVGLSYSNGSSV